MDRFKLISHFFNGDIITLPDNNGEQVRGVISSIEREDGSGYLFNVTMDRMAPYPAGKAKSVTIFVRTPRWPAPSH
jgi:hypothetical protein